MLRVRHWIMGAIVAGVVGIASASQAAVIFTVGAVGGSGNTWPGAETPPNAVDNNTATKYLNFAKLNTGFLITPTSPGVATGLNLSTANDAVERDPTSYMVFGSNSAVANTTAGTTYDSSGFTLISSGVVVPPATRLTAYTPVTFPNSTSYSSYLVLFPTVFNPVAANSMQISEADLVGISSSGAVVAGGVADPAVVPEPTSLALIGLGGAALFARRRKA